jgi:hypothetical protein
MPLAPVYTYYTLNDFSGGVNQFPEKALPNQVITASNVWAPNRRAEQRPGLYYAGLGGSSGGSAFSSSTVAAYQQIYKGTLITGSPAGDTWQVLYFLLDGATFSLATSPNLAATKQLYWQYMAADGVWRPLPGNFTTNGRQIYSGQVPDDWIGQGGAEGYNIRCIAPTPISSTPIAGSIGYDPLGPPSVYALAYAATLQGKFFVTAYKDAGSGGLGLLVRDALKQGSVTYASGTFALQTQPPVRPPTVAVIPDFNVVYMTVNDIVYDCSPGSASVANTITAAAVNTDPNVVGPRVTTNGVTFTPEYSSDIIATDSTFPAAQLLCYFGGLVFAVVNDFTVKWSAPAVDGAYNIWPSTNFETLGEDDNSPIVAIAPLNEQLVVYKRDSIYIMVPGAPDPSDITQQATFQPTRVVSGVGCIASGSVQSCRGKHIFRARDGWYQFDGTPNIQKISAPIDTLARSIDYGTASTMTSADWMSQHCYVCAYDGATGREVLCYDYENQAWWPWAIQDEIQFLLSAERPDFIPTLYACTNVGVIGEFNYAREDFGLPIECTFTTHRMGEKERGTMSAREVRVESVSGIDDIDIELIYDDEDGTQRTLSLNSIAEPKWGTATWHAFNWTNIRRRERKASVRGPVAQWYQLKVSTTPGTTNRLWKVVTLVLGIMRYGRR